MDNLVPKENESKEVHGTSKLILRVEFCDTLRSLAIIIVVFSHYLIGFPALPGFLYNPSDVTVFYSLHEYLSWLDGAYGVAIFFLISGFLIPLSIKRYGVKSFFIARFFRLVPTYSACLLIVICVSLIFGTMQLEGALLLDYLLNITMMRDIIGGKILDSVIWTLEVEAKFYLYLGVLYLLLKKYFYYCSLLNILVFSLFILGNVSPMYRYLGTISFMFVGVCFHFIYFGSRNEKIVSIAAIIPNLLIMIYSFNRYYSGDFVSIIYFKSLIVFLIVISIFKFVNAKTPSYIKYIANISYPLYAIHVIGYPLLSYFCYKLGLNGGAALVVTILIICLFSHLIHKLIENPSIQIGRKFYSET